MKGINWTLIVLSACVFQAGSALATSTPSIPATETSGLEKSLASGLKAQTLQILIDSKMKTLPKETEITGFKCSTIPEFAKEEGLDALVRFLALKQLQKVQGISLSDDEIHILKNIPMDQLRKLRQQPDAAKAEKSAAQSLLKGSQAQIKVTLKKYIAEAKKARSFVWQKMPIEVKSQIASEILENARSGLSLVSDGNLFDEEVLSSALMDPTLKNAMIKTRLCFADLQLPDDVMVNVLIPVRNGTLDSLRPVVEVGATAEKLEKSNSLVPEMKE